MAACHLGQFNGAYLVDRPLPAQQLWMYRGRARDWSAKSQGGGRTTCHAMPPRRRAGAEPAPRLSAAHNFLAQRDRLVAVLDRLPVCLCHHDAFRRNLLARVHAMLQSVV